MIMMISLTISSTSNIFLYMLVILISHPCYCYPHKRELNNFPQVINILEDGRNEQLKQTQILQNISTALGHDKNSIILQEQSNILQEQSNGMITVVAALASQSEILASISTILDKLLKTAPTTARDCSDIASQGPYMSGPYTITPWDGQRPFKVFCDFESDENSGWIVIQRQFDGSVDFNRDWEEYKDGFGDLEGEFWLGLNSMFRLTRTGGPWQLRVELEDFGGNSAYAQYGDFAVGNEKTNFQLISVGQYEGTAGDSIDYHATHEFTTIDRENSASDCAHLGAWWHYSCYKSNLNGQYRTSELTTYDGINWRGWKDQKTLKSSTMKIKSKHL